MGAAEGRAGETSAATTIPPAARWLLPTLGNACLAAILFLLLFQSHRLLGDGDTGWHIRTGDLIREAGEVPRVDPFSYTMPGQEWFAWEWLADVLMSWLHSAFGLRGVVGGAMLLLWLTFLALYRWTVARGTDPVVAAASTVFAALLTSTHWLARPHLLSLPLLIAAHFMLERFRYRRERWIYALPAVVAIWANTHGAFVVVFPMLAIYAADEIVEFAKRGLPRSDVPRVVSTYVSVGVLAAGASLLTPFGWALHEHIWNYVTDATLMSVINEFQSPDFHTITGRLVEGLLGLAAGASIGIVAHRRWAELGMVILWSHLMLQSVRHVPLAACIILPIAMPQWSAWLIRWVHNGDVSGGSAATQRSGLAGIAILDRQLSGVVWHAAMITFLLGVIVHPRGGQLLDARFRDDRHPTGAAEFIATNNLQGNVYAPDQYGGYLVYRFFPERRVFVDGRSDFYNTGELLADFQKLIGPDPSWSRVLDKYQVQWLLLRRDEPLSVVARASGTWTPAYVDQYSEILGRAGSASGPP